MLDFRVATFLAVCQSMNYTHAAETLNITQPAVSQHIAYLERRYGAKLFDYHRRRLSLTQAGVTLRDALATIAHDEEMLTERIAHLHTGSKVHLSVGLTLTAGEYMIASPLAYFLATHPQYRITVHSGGTEELLDQLNAGTIDCAFVEGFFDKSAYAWNTYRREQLVGVCSATHAFAHEPHTIEDILNEAVIVREQGSGTRAVLEHSLAAHNLSLGGFARIDVVDSLSIIKKFVAHDLGISFLYEAAITQEVSQGILRRIELEDFSIKHSISFIRLPHSVFEQELQQLYHHLEAGDYRSEIK